MSNASDLVKFIKGFINVDEAKMLPPNNKFTITYAGPREVGESKELKPVLEFAEIRKGLVLSGGRVTQLTKLFGADSSLIGKQVRLAIEELRGRECIKIVAPEEV